MTKYRSKVEITAAILNAVGKGAKKTRIMYIANLSYNLLEKYLKKIIKASLLRVNDNFYRVTEKGRIFLERYERFSSKYSKLKKEYKSIMFEMEALERMCELEKGPRATNPRSSRQRNTQERRLR